MHIAYIAHPVSGDIQENLESIRKIVRHINLTEPDTVPFAHYWLDCHALNDDHPMERRKGIANDKEFFCRGFINSVRLYGFHVSPGMIEEVKLAIKYNIPVVPMTDETSTWYENFEF